MMDEFGVIGSRHAPALEIAAETLHVPDGACVRSSMTTLDDRRTKFPPVMLIQDLGHEDAYDYPVPPCCCPA